MGRERKDIDPKCDPAQRAFAEHISRLVDADGRLIEEIAKAAGMSKSVLGKYRNGGSRPRIGYELARLAHALGMHPRELIPDLPTPPDLLPKPRRKASG